MPSVLTELRALCPQRPLPPAEALSVAERQAHKLLRLQGVAFTPVPEQVVEHLPRVSVRWVSGTQLSGAVTWTGGRYVILVNRDEAWVRQRFSLAHEFKHLLDLPAADVLYRNRGVLTAERQRERAADYFAACLLMPKTLMRRAFYNEGSRDERALARRFQVSVQAMRIRIEQLRLFEPEGATL